MVNALERAAYEFDGNQSGQDDFETYEANECEDDQDEVVQHGEHGHHQQQHRLKEQCDAPALLPERLWRALSRSEGRRPAHAAQGRAALDVARCAA